MKFEKIEPGMILYDRHRVQAGNTTMRRMSEWGVIVVSVDKTRRCAEVRWNGNPPRTWYARALEKLKTWSRNDDCAETTDVGMCGFKTRMKKGAKVPPARKITP